MKGTCRCIQKDNRSTKISHLKSNLLWKTQQVQRPPYRIYIHQITDFCGCSCRRLSVSVNIMTVRPDKTMELLIAISRITIFSIMQLDAIVNRVYYAKILLLSQNKLRCCGVTKMSEKLVRPFCCKIICCIICYCSVGDACYYSLESRITDENNRDCFTQPCQESTSL